ncbi:integrator complex subunit 6 [Drosophila mojavensis]|uniref:integrator complex subunit 6 n=1 Tax=Drosophila mojavensis TaxID=7230 RepID=UPI0013EEC6EC|nr:integrator complex subunit 6 [Drosophila mojavensis]
MTIILFLVDTSSSMCQKAYVNGVQKTYLDIAKGAVETFLKYRQRTQDCLGDRYMLLTFEEPPANVKAGWKENHATFMNELKNLQSHGLTSMGESLRNAFDLLNLNRMQSGIDTYGQGRCPFYLEPSVIIVITDGGRYSYRNGVHQEIILPLSNQIPGTKFTKEPFRWDQRLFSLVLRMPGNKIDERVDGKVPHDDSPIERMCEVTGGRSYRVRSHYVLNQCIESLVQKVQPGVVLQFEPMLPKESTTATAAAAAATTTITTATVAARTAAPTADIVFQPIKKMIYVQKHITQKTFPIGYWPLPEPYWPDSKAITLPPRDAHPKLKILTPAVDEPQLVRSFPVDKYEIEGCPLTLQILNKREMNKCWQVIVTNGMHGFELPFGYLKASPNFSQVHLYVLAYNYPALLPLLHDLIHKYNMSPPNDLMYKFNAYVRSIPPYYCPFLRKALVNINVPYQLLQFLLPENVDNYLSPTIANQLKHIKNTAKQDQENLCLKVYKQLKQPKPPYRQVETAKLCTGAALRRDLVRHPLLRDTFAKLHAEIEPVENYTIVVPQLTHQSSAKSYRNPFDIPRRDLVDEIARMRETFMRPTSMVAKDSGHCLPIAEMGNYQEYLKNKDNPLREIEPTNVRQHMFGNPYKKDKHMVMVDEADLSDVAPMKSGNNSNGGNGANSPSSSGSGGNSSGMGPVGGGGMSGLMLGGGNGLGGPMGPISKKLESTSRGRKRKAGPLPRAFEFRRMSVDSLRSSSSSPSSIGGGSASSSVSELDLDEDSNSSYGSEASHSSINSNSSSNSSSSSIIMNSSSSNSSGLSSNNMSIASGNSDSGMSVGSHTPERMSFDFSEEEVSDQETPLNGYVHNFINGISDEERANEADNNPTAAAVPDAMSATAGNSSISSSSSIAAIAASNGVPELSISSSSSSINNGSSSSSNSSHHNAFNSSSGVFYLPLNGLTMQHAAYSSNVGTHTPMDSPLHMLESATGMHKVGGGVAAMPPLLLVPNGYPSQHAAMLSPPPVPVATATAAAAAATVTPAAPAATTTANSSPTTSTANPTTYFSHNDINDASEISRILQTCHNGNSSSTINTSSSSSSNNNNNSSSSSSSNSSSNNSSSSSNNHLVNGFRMDMDPISWNCFDALKRTPGGSSSSSTTTPSWGSWGSGLTNSNNTNNNSSSNNNGSNNNSSNNNSSNNNSNHNRAYNNSSPKLEPKVSPTHVGNNNNNNNSNNASNNTIGSNSNSINDNGDIRSSPELILTEEQREAARKHNIDLRMQVFRDIRRPGRDYSQLLEHLNMVKGDLEMKSDFIDMCISESMRFRRHQMVNSIQEWWERNQQQLEISKS